MEVPIVCVVGGDGMKEVEGFLAPYSQEVRDLAMAARSFVLGTIPDVLEQVDPSGKIIGYGFSPKYADTICMIMPTKAGVNLGIAYAVELPDPKKLLDGTGKLHRHVKLKKVSDLTNPALKALLKAGIARWEKTGRKAVTSRT